MSQPRVQGSWRRRVVAVLTGGLALLVFIPAGPADAHATLLSSSPATGAVVEPSPAAIELTFDEPVRTVADGFRLFDHSGAQQSLSGTAADETVRIELPADLGDGTFVVSWRVVSGDSHPVSGALTFAVGRADGGSVRVVQSDSAAVAFSYGALQSLGYLAILTLVGLTVFETGVLRSLPTDRRQRRRVTRVAVGAAGLAYITLVPITRVREEGGVLSDLLRPSTFTSGWFSAAGGTVLLVLAGSSLVLLAGRSVGRRLRDVAGITGGVVVMTSVLPVGHARTYGPTWLVLSADVLHAGTAAVWLGGLIGLGMLLTKANRSVSDPRQAAVVLSRFSTLAGGLVAVLTATGLILAVVIVGSIEGLLNSTYGHLLLVKLGFAGSVVGLAAWNRFHLVPRLSEVGGERQSWRRLTRAVVVEAFILVLVISVTGALVMSSPASKAQGYDTPAVESQPTVVSTSLATDLGSGHFTGTIAPGRVGSNSVVFQLTDASDKPISPVALPEVQVSSPLQGIGYLTADVQPGGITGEYRAIVTLPVPGTWQIEVAVRVSEFQQPLAIVNAVVAP
jgi:copper transport protein